MSRKVQGAKSTHTAQPLRHGPAQRAYQGGPSLGLLKLCEASQDAAWQLGAGPNKQLNQVIVLIKLKWPKILPACVNPENCAREHSIDSKLEHTFQQGKHDTEDKWGEDVLRSLQSQRLGICCFAQWMLVSCPLDCCPAWANSQN